MSLDYYVTECRRIKNEIKMIEIKIDTHKKYPYKGSSFNLQLLHAEHRHLLDRLIECEDNIRFILGR